MPLTSATQLIRLGNIQSRANRLWDDGYTYEQSRVHPQSYWVYKPNRDGCYIVNLRSEHCTCPSFEHDQTCKHFLAVRDAVEEENARADAAFEQWTLEQDARHDLLYAEF